MEYPGIEDGLLANLTASGTTAVALRDINDRGIADVDEKLRKMMIPIRGPPCGGDTIVRELRIVLLGKTGSGKSSTGNLILGQPAFKTSAGSSSCTPTIKESQTRLDGITVRIIDTPGTFGEEASKEAVTCEIAKVLQTFSDGVHVFLFVHNFGNPRFTHEQQEAFNEMECLFGSEFVDHCVVCITHANDMVKDKSLEEYMNEEFSKETTLGTFLKTKLKGKVLAVDNGDKLPYARTAQAKQIVHYLSQVVGNALSRVYTNEHFKMVKQEREQAEREPGAMTKELKMANQICFSIIYPVILGNVKEYIHRTSLNQLRALNGDYEKVASKLLSRVKTEIAGQPSEAVLDAGVTLLIKEVLKAEVGGVSDPGFLKKIEPFASSLFIAGSEMAQYLVQNPHQLQRLLAAIGWWK